MKICSKCNQYLSLDNFSKDAQKKDWLRSSCKHCNKKWKSPEEKHLVKLNDILKWFLTCTKCNKYLSLDNFRKDKSKKTWYYSSCNDCNRLSKWIIKMTPAKKYNCDNCWIEFKPKVNQFNNKIWKIYCSRKCEMDISLQNRENPYLWYREYILKRDNYKCVISWSTENLDIHHIKTRGSWWWNEYQNLITLSRWVHISLAHWPDALKYKKIFLEYTSKFSEPDFWWEIIEKSYWDNLRSKLKNKKRSKVRYNNFIKKFKDEHDWLSPSQYAYRKQKEYKNNNI